MWASNPGENTAWILSATPPCFATGLVWWLHPILDRHEGAVAWYRPPVGYGLRGDRTVQERLGAGASHAPTEISRAFIGSPVPTSVHCRADWARRMAEIRMVVCYDAGFDALWPAGSLAELGIECRVLDFASIQLIAGRVV